MVEKKVRHFGGKLFVFVDYKTNPGARAIRNLEKKHLKSYLRGDKRFSYGKDINGHTMWFFVKEVWLNYGY